MKLIFGLLSLIMGSSVQIEPLFWNTSNPVFTESPRSNGAKLDVRVGEKLDIHCPLSENKNQPNYLKVYLVDSRSFDICSTESPTARVMVTCNSPDKPKKFTLLVQEVSPNPFGFEFQRGETYYLISTSDGSENGIDKPNGGVCSKYNMKLKLAVSDSYIEESEILISSGSLNTEKLKREMIPWDTRARQLEAELDQVVNEEVEIVATSGFTVGIIIGALTVLLLIVSAVVGYKWWSARGDIRKATYIHRPKNHEPTSEVHLTLVPAGGQYPFSARTTRATTQYTQGNIYNPIYKKESPSNTFNSRQESLGENSCGSELTYLAPVDGGVVEV